MIIKEAGHGCSCFDQRKGVWWPNPNDVQDKFLAISRWKTMDEWSRWVISQEPREYREGMDALINGETKVEIYEQ